MATKATAGPWEYIVGDGIRASGYRIASLSYAGKPISQKISYDGLDANARLIAAAPELRDLVEATEITLTNVLQVFGERALADVPRAKLRTARDRLRALLAGIEGGDHGDN